MTKKSSDVPVMAIGHLSTLLTAGATPSPSSDGPSISGESNQATDLNGIIKDYLAFIADMDRQSRQHLKKAETPISCHTCTHPEPGCCYQKVLVNFIEAIPIAMMIRDAGNDTPVYRELLREAGEEMEAGTRDRWFFEERRPCVFLQAGRCSIYQLRPMVCRTYWVLSPSEDCQITNTTQRIKAVDLTPIMAACIQAAMQIHTLLRLKETPMRVLMGALPRVVLIALEVLNSGDYQATIRAHRWPTRDELGAHWEDGNNPFTEKLYQIRKAKEG